MSAYFSISNKPRSTKFKVLKWIVMTFYVDWLFCPILEAINMMKELSIDDSTVFEYGLIALLFIIWITLALFFIIIIIGFYLENFAASLYVAFVSILMLFFSIIFAIVDTDTSSNQVIDNLWRFGVILFHICFLCDEGGSACTIFGIE